MGIFNNIFGKNLETPDFNKKSGGLSLVCTIIFLIFQCHFLSAQKIYRDDDDQFRLSLQENDPEIYSADKDFESQKKGEKIVSNTTLISKADISDKKYSVIGYKKKSLKNSDSLRIQVGNDKIRKGKNFSRKVEKNRSEYHKKREKFLNDHFSATQQNDDSQTDYFYDQNYTYSNNSLFLSTQEITTPRNDQPQLISLENGAEIYSADNNFNQQVNDGAIVFNDVLISNVDISDKRYLVIASRMISHEDFDDQRVQVGKSELEEKDDLLRKVKKEISAYEKRKEEFLADHFEGYPSPGDFSDTQKKNTDYISHRTDRKDFANPVFIESCYTVKKALSHLHTQDYTYYNNKSLDFCFSEIFSVRPPPAFSIA